MKDLDSKKGNQILEKLRKKAIGKNRKCLFGECNNNCNKGHILQEKGIISNIANSKNKLYELNYNNFFNDINIQFEYRGKNEIFKRKLFCSSHDDKLFSSIEKQETDYRTYNDFLLLSYRALANEIRKKEIAINYIEMALEENEVSDIWKKDNEIQMEGLISGIKDLSFSLSKVYSDLFAGNNSFEYGYCELPKEVEIALSGFVTFETSEELKFLSIYNPKYKPTEVFYHLIPLKDKTIFVYGYNKNRKSFVENYFSVFNSNNTNKILKQISNILILLNDQWICSERFYTSNIKPIELEIIRIMHWNRYKNENERIDLKINLFSTTKKSLW